MKIRSLWLFARRACACVVFVTAAAFAQPSGGVSTSSQGGRQTSSQGGGQQARPQNWGAARHTEGEIAEITEQFTKLADFYRVMAGNYLDTIDYSAVVEKGIVKMLGELDPHSYYLTAKELQTSTEEMGGSFSGIGIEFNTLADTIIVVNTIGGGPAEKVGIRPNDRIVMIDNQDVIGLSRNAVPSRLRGPKGTKVEVRVMRRGEANPLDFTMIRDDIPINTVDAAYRPAPNTGYIKVNRFGATTGREFSEAFDRLNESQTIDALIVDLRGNGGGYLPEAIRMSEFFLDRGQRIVSTEGKLYPAQHADAQADGRFNRGRLIVLVDEVSASASEIVAGAIQDWDRGIIVGAPTFGKGLVQREFGLNDGSAIRLTIARYLTPTGRAIQRPYERGHAEDYYRNAYERQAQVVEKEDITTANAPEYKTLRSGRTVRGGGGITPDVAVAVDTTGYSRYLSSLIRSGILREFVVSQMDTSRERLKKDYRTVEDFIARFDARALLPELANYAERNKIARDEEGLNRSGKWITEHLKALIAQQLWGMEGYYRVAHAEFDEGFAKALDMMNRWRTAPKDLQTPPENPQNGKAQNEVQQADSDEKSAGEDSTKSSKNGKSTSGAQKKSTTKTASNAPTEAVTQYLIDFFTK